MWFIVSALFLCVLVPNADTADGTAWCYHLPSCNYTTWPTNNAPYCNGTRQSPIDINTNTMTVDSKLTPFTFKNYNLTNVLTKIENTNRTVKVAIGSGVTVSGGGLGESYDSLQFHLHWGNRTTVPGSEHTVNGVRYPMELHIVNSKSSLNGDTSLAVKDPAGLAALGFFIEAMPDSATESPESWKNLTSYLASITEGGQSATITHPISLDSLLHGVDFTKYYRYNGSLTTPACNEAVVWTVFKDTIKVSKDLINLFSSTVRIGNSESELMVNVYRGIQPALPVQASFSSNDIEWCYHLPTCGYTTWPTNNAPYCNGTRQSPIDINTTNVTVNSNLTPFTFQNFDQTNVLTKIQNTKRTVKVTITSGVIVSGGGLGESYDALQFHLHWGNYTTVPGSEHTVNGVRYPMELHIVTSKSSLNGNTSLAVTDPAGLAALGFFIEVMPGSATESPEGWKNLTSYLENIKEGGQSATITHPISLDSLLSGVNFTKYYRYNGSLTTPTCNEAVVWTVFKDTIKVSADLINLFSSTVRIGNNESELMVNVYRGIQSALPVQASFSHTSPAASIGVFTVFSLNLVGIILVLANS